MQNTMIIDDKKVVSLAYTLKNQAGDVLDSASAEEPFIYLHGAQNIIPGLEKALNQKTADDEFDVHIPAKDAYGERDEALTQSVPKEMFGEIDDEHLYVGAQFQAEANGGMQVVTILDVADDTITLDGNHPLAGKELHFNGRVLAVRDATDDELMHGHAHAADSSCSQ